ncbi:DNA-binding response regulator [Streptomyces triticagri]|uniref:DNA-binding response regulator n=1 Tax=Streptomyces triticagri TaxID=2293568 RepID=A0A372LV12_9ACTN|nr:response regulator transcription factor [Streptomyces triticagri]RFU82508.1 DNA-binding response regulator [Streptomyces triticagri]
MRIVLAEDHFLLRDGLSRLLGAFGHEVVAAVDNGPELQRQLTEQEPDIAIVDVRLPPGFSDEGLRAAVAARQQQPGLPVLLLSQYVEPLYARELLSTGSSGVGYVLKERVSNGAEFVATIDRVASGGTAMDPEVVSKLVTGKNRDEPMNSLTEREREVLECLAQGRSNAGIAEALFITEKAVAKHIGNIFPKLGLPPSDTDNRRVLAVLAYLDR